MQGVLYFLLIMLLYIGIPIVIIAFCWRFKRIAVIFIGLILIEQVSLKIMEFVIINDRRVVEEFAIENIPLPNEFERICKEMQILFVYSYKICLEYYEGYNGRLIVFQLPAGYLTLIPRNYPDRSIFDSKGIAWLNPDGTIKYNGDENGSN